MGSAGARISLLVTLAVLVASCLRAGFKPSSEPGTQDGRPRDGVTIGGESKREDRSSSDRFTAAVDGWSKDRALLDSSKADGSSVVKGDLGVVSGTWVTIAKGAFLMGSPASEACRTSASGIPWYETQHQVTLTHGFEMQATEVTQGQFQQEMGYNPSSFSSCGAGCPVENVSWHEMAAYCNVLSKKKAYTACYQCTGSQTSTTCSEAQAYSGAAIYSCPGYRLPSEAEWEYAYRAGTTLA